MQGSYEIKSFKNKKEAEELLKKSRDRIDEIDNELFDLISQRTSLAKDIVLAQEYIGMPIYDKSREDAIHEKVKKFSEEKNLDVEIIRNAIVNLKGFEGDPRYDMLRYYLLGLEDGVQSWLFRRKSKILRTVRLYLGLF